MPEIQYLAYLHNAEDQLRGEAATLQFFSPASTATRWWCGSPGYAYQKGFGGHFHNDNAVGVLRDIPGLVIASPARPDDAAAMLRTCLAAARTDGTVCVFLEPIALYHTRDLYDAGDGGWLAPYRARDGRTRTCRSAAARTYGDGARPHDRHVRQRGADVAAGGPTAGRAGIGAGSSTCAGWRRCRSTICCARPVRPAGCWSSTRHAAPAASRRA